MTICLNADYSTTRLLSKIRPQRSLDLPPNPTRISEGGLRTNGYFKFSSQEKPLITVIIVVLNRVQALMNCIRSVIEQQYDNVELIIIDGASTDGTLNLLVANSDKINYWVSEEDNGIYSAMNKGVSIASGDWYYFINSDDVLVECLDYIAKFLKDTHTIYYGETYMKTRNILYDGHFSQYKMAIYCINHQSVFFPKSVFDKYSYDENYSLFADYVLLCKCNKDKNLTFKHIDKLIAIYDENGISKTSIDYLFINNRINIIKDNFPLPIFFLFILRIFIVKILNLLGIKKLTKRLINRLFHMHYDTRY